MGFHSINQVLKRWFGNNAFVRHLPFIKYSHVLNQLDAIVVPDLNLAFIPNPKAANRSIKLAIARKLNPNYHGNPHRINWATIPKNKLRGTEYFKFGIVRNPLQRLQSCYIQKIVVNARAASTEDLFWRYGNTFHADMSFEEFVIAVSKIPDWYSEIHFRSQHRFFYNKNNLAVDFIGRFEDLENDWNVINQTCDLGPLPHLNQANGKFCTTRFTYETAQLACQRYTRDIDLFGYQNEVDQLLNQLRIQVICGSDERV